VEVVGVLRDEEPEFAKPLELEECQMGCVWRYFIRRNPPPWCGKSSVAPRPHPLRATKVGDARVGADACTRKGDQVTAFGDQPGDLLHVALEALLTGHVISLFAGLIASVNRSIR
jgi:hypothetical protein